MHQSFVSSAVDSGAEVPFLDLSIVPAVPWNCGSFDSMPKPAGVLSHLPAGIWAGL